MASSASIAGMATPGGAAAMSSTIHFFTIGSD